ncbi:hypothetical protein [Ferrimicrobium acidiphilum]|uniref:Uncharacterized protein n=1 Tax=Ferrimicrobium acidiphilum DSM 19497 TaxID=1121877 RepID=A0A0D8FPV0_9ACTN|nr:hypothetical protein [Ferrimicrobium acidiphilum]KJE75293.1 hypothetical protein FEAC_29900 [Ferrimicrobium acidiphilum DSM 19497]
MNTRLDRWIPFILLIGGVIVPVVGWLVGVYLLFRSNVWTTKQKVIAALVLPFGLLPAFLVFLTPVKVVASNSTAAAAGPNYGLIVVWIALIVAPVLNYRSLKRSLLSNSVNR